MYDPYYETKVNPRWGSLPIGSLLGGTLILLGIASVIFSIIDLHRGVPPVTGSAWQENSMWPTIGKGIWVGAVMIATGIVGIISQRERTQVSLYVFNALCWITAILSLYQLLSSILHIQPYKASALSSKNSRTNRQNLEVAMNSLLITAGGLGFLTSIFAGLLSCLAGNCCNDRRNAIKGLISNAPVYRPPQYVPVTPGPSVLPTPIPVPVPVPVAPRMATRFVPRVSSMGPVVR